MEGKLMGSERDSQHQAKILVKCTAGAVPVERREDGVGEQN